MTTVQECPSQGAARREYVSPQLVRYGSVNDLTASGSNGQAECQGNGNGNNSPCRP